MEDNRSFSNLLVDNVMNIVYKVLRKEKILLSEFHMGTVESVISPTQLKAFVDGGTTAVTCSCNPDVTFNINDNVIVLYIAKNSNNRFVLCRR